jgi:hypothetical protein
VRFILSAYLRRAYLRFSLRRMPCPPKPDAAHVGVVPVAGRSEGIEEFDVMLFESVQKQNVANYYLRHTEIFMPILTKSTMKNISTSAIGFASMLNESRGRRSDGLPDVAFAIHEIANQINTTNH